ncbi:hypothetical protein VTK26DRAFT_5991 [Humicola hyalothermophila]
MHIFSLPGQNSSLLSSPIIQLSNIFDLQASPNIITIGSLTPEHFLSLLRATSNSKQQDNKLGQLLNLARINTNNHPPFKPADLPELHAFQPPTTPYSPNHQSSTTATIPTKKFSKMASNHPIIAEAALYLSSLILPPLAVYLKEGAKHDFGVNMGLTVLGWVPGILHALYKISSSPSSGSGSGSGPAPGPQGSGSGAGAPPAGAPPSN